jgi:hypothetical protein
MNKFSFSLLSLLIMASSFLVSSCKDDDEPVSPPTITITGTDNPEAVTVNPGQAVSFTLTVNASGGFSALHINKSGGVPAEPVVITRGSSVEKVYHHEFLFSPSIDEAGETILFTFKAVDEGSREVTATYTVTVNAPEVNDYQEVVIGGRYNKTIGNLYSMLDNQVFFHSEAVNHKDLIDFLYYFNETNNFTIAAPSDAYTRIVFSESISLEGMDNETFFVRTSADIASLTTPEQIESAWTEMAEGTPSTLLPNLATGVTFAFRLDESRGSRYGVAQVLNLENETTQTRKITLRIKIAR